LVDGNSVCADQTICLIIQNQNSGLFGDPFSLNRLRVVGFQSFESTKSPITKRYIHVQVRFFGNAMFGVDLSKCHEWSRLRMLRASPGTLRQNTQEIGLGFLQGRSLQT
jgi:hypothetical protein